MAKDAKGLTARLLSGTELPMADGGVTRVALYTGTPEAGGGDAVPGGTYPAGESFRVNWTERVEIEGLGPQ